MLLGDGFRQTTLLAQELEVVCQAPFVQLAAVDGGSHGAARFRFVVAIPEAAIESDGLDIFEDLFEPLFRLAHGELPHPRDVEQQAAPRHRVQGSRRGCVPAMGVVFADGTGRLQDVAREAVEQRRLADTG